MKKGIVYTLLLMMGLGLAWGVDFKVQKSERTQKVGDFYSTLLDGAENQVSSVYEQLEPLMTEDSRVDLDQLALVLEPKMEDMSASLELNKATIRYEVGEEFQCVSDNTHGFFVPVTLIVDGVLTDLIEQEEINQQKTVTTGVFFSKTNNKWKVLEFNYLDDKALLVF